MVAGRQPAARAARRCASTIRWCCTACRCRSARPIRSTPAYLDELAALAAEVEPAWVSDHLCWGSYGGHHAHDLLPLPYTEEALAHVAERVLRVQDRLKRQHPRRERLELRELSALDDDASGSSSPRSRERADCGLLLDVNNVFVERAQPRLRRARLHRRHAARIASGRSTWRATCDEGPLLLDTHDHPVCDGVWELYRAAVERFGRVSTLVEWDDHIPPFERVLEESDRARAVENEVLAAAMSPTRSGLRAEAHARELQRRFFSLITAPEGVAQGAASRSA